MSQDAGGVLADILSLPNVEQDTLAKVCVEQPGARRFVAALLAEAEAAGMLVAKKRVLKKSKVRTPDPNFHGNYRYLRLIHGTDRKIATVYGISYDALRQRKSRAKKAKFL
jgi:hypothetical protein